MLKGGQIADVPITFASIDPCMSCTNRAIVVNSKTKNTSLFGYEELHRLSVEKTRELEARSGG
jgi:membrane-bound hydrogenase subunit alpha